MRIILTHNEGNTTTTVDGVTRFQQSKETNSATITVGSKAEKTWKVYKDVTFLIVEQEPSHVCMTCYGSGDHQTQYEERCDDCGGTGHLDPNDDPSINDNLEQS